MTGEQMSGGGANVQTPAGSPVEHAPSHDCLYLAHMLTQRYGLELGRQHSQQLISHPNPRASTGILGILPQGIICFTSAQVSVDLTKLAGKQLARFAFCDITVGTDIQSC